jgi:hypothetical protein
VGIVKVCFGIWVHNANIVCDVHWNNGILDHDMGIAMGIPSHSVDFKRTV